MSFLDTLTKLLPGADLAKYLAGQRDDHRKWFAHHLRGVTPGELTLGEVAAEEASWRAMRDVLLHGSPPEATHD